MDIIIKKTISREVLEDIFVTAFEGGSNYWYFLSDESVAKIRKAVPKSEDEYLSTAILKAVLDHGVDIDINDAENEDEVVGTLSSSTFKDRLQDLANGDMAWALESHINENGDATSADIVFQYLAMGETVYG